MLIGDESSVRTAMEAMLFMAVMFSVAVLRRHLVRFLWCIGRSYVQIIRTTGRGTCKLRVIGSIAHVFSAVEPFADRCKIHNKFMRLRDDGNMDGAGPKGKDELPSDWTWERFAVVTQAAEAQRRVLEFMHFWRRVCCVPNALNKLTHHPKRE